MSDVDLYQLEYLSSIIHTTHHDSWRIGMLWELDTRAKSYTTLSQINNLTLPQNMLVMVNVES